MLHTTVSTSDLIVTFEYTACNSTSYNVFVNRLKNMMISKSENKMKKVISTCLREIAQVWHIIELTNLEKDLLRTASLNQWYEVLIKRFKMRDTIVISVAVGLGQLNETLSISIDCLKLRGGLNSMIGSKNFVSISISIDFLSRFLDKIL